MSIQFIKSLTAPDVYIGISHGVWHSRHHLIRSYLVVPTGIVVLFTILYGLNKLLTNVIKIKFPASVLGMLINLIFLCLLSYFSTLKQTGKNIDAWKSGADWVLTSYLRLIKPSMNFTLVWINVFFIPSFIVLPLSEPITIVECLKIAAVFIIGLIALFCVDVYMIIGFKWVLNYFGVYKDDLDHKVEESESEEDGGVTPPRGFTEINDITTIELSSFKSEPILSPRHSGPSSPAFTSPSISHPAPTYWKDAAITKYNTHPQIVDGVDTSSTISREESVNDLPANDPGLSENQQTIILFITQYIDWILYATLFLVSIPFYYVRSIHTFLPYHLGLTILSYRFALLVPQKWPSTKKFAHPILISTAIILFVCFIGSLIFHGGQPKGFLEDLMFYKTGRTYLYLFNSGIMLNNGKLFALQPDNYTATPKWPGCGDFLSSLMDISIVALSLPMFTHRRDFIRNFWILMPPIIVSIGLTFFIYPIVSHAVGIESGRSIGFIGRSVTLALGVPLVNALEGSLSLAAVSTILSGIIGVLIEDPIFKLLRVPANDYVTRGVSLGINCGAIATAHLLNTNPRAASMSSLSFSTFGTVMIIMASIGPVRHLIRSLVGL